MFLDNYKKDENSKSTISHYIGTIFWYIIFIGILPFLLKKESYLRIYFPLIDLVANALSSSGKKNNNIFKDLYKLSPNNIISFLSTNFINLVALSGVALNGAYYILKTSNKWLGIKVMLIMYTITYLLPTQGINWIVKYIQSKINNLKDTHKKFHFLNPIKDFMKRNSLLFDYLGGFIVVALLVSFETLIIDKYLHSVNKNI